MRDAEPASAPKPKPAMGERAKVRGIMLATPILLALTLATQAAPTVAAPAFNVVNVPPNVAQFCAEHLSAELTNRGLRVITATEINALIGMERQKQLLGCDEQASQNCMAELAAALGTEGLMLGQLAKLGQSYQINVKIIRSDNGQPLSNYLGSAPNEEALVQELSRAADKLARESLKALRPNEAQVVKATPEPAITATKRPPELSDSPSNRRWPLIPTIAAGAFGVASGVTFGLALGKRNQVASGAFATRADAQPAVDSGQTMNTLALATGGLAVAALGTAAVMYFLSAEDAPAVALVPTTNGVAFGWVIR